MTAVVMPAVLNERLAAVAAVVRRARLVRGLSYAAVAVVGAGLLAVLADSAYQFSRGGRLTLFAGWLAVGAVSVWRLILRPLRRPVRYAELAAVVERHFPTLAERLSTLVGLHEHADQSNGSRQLMFHLAKETAQRSKRLNFHRAVPVGRAVRTGLYSALFVLLVLSPVLYVSGAMDQVRRFLLPWYAPTVQVPYRIVVTSGSPVVKRGDAVTVAAYLERTKDDGVLPDAATLVYRDAGSSTEKKLSMTADDKAGFGVTRPGVTDGFEYAVEAGPIRSEWFTVTAADPVDLAEGTTVIVTAPEYARAVLPAKTLLGFGEFEGLERSAVAFDLKFTRRASAASLDWKPSVGPIGYVPVPLAVVADGHAATATFPLREDGAFRLVLTGDHGLKSDFTVAVRATKDQPPSFEKVVGFAEQALEVRPGEKIPVEVVAADDFAVSQIQLEYALADPKAIPRTVPIDAAGLNTPRAGGKAVFDLADKARDGEVVYLRLRAFDNRAVPEDKVQPQEAVYPPNGWVKLTVNKSARPLAEQQVFGQRDKIKEKLREAAEALAEADKEAAKVQEQAKDGALTDDQQARLNNAAEKARDAKQALDDAARQAGVVPGLREVAGEAAKIADGPVQAGGSAARRANNEPKPDERGKQIDAARAGFAEAKDRVDKLITRNDDLAKARLAPKRLEELAAEEAKLATETKDPNRAKALANQQKKIEDDLAAAVAETPELKRAADGKTNSDAQKLAADAAKLAADHDALKTARAATERANKEKENASFAERQRKLADAAADLDAKTRTASRVAGADPLDKGAFDKAADALQKNAPLAAMTEQEKAARELDRLASALEQATAARGDAKDAAKQLAKWQEDLKKRVAAYSKDDGFDKLPKHVKEHIRKEQEAIAKAAAGLKPPAGDDSSAAAKADAVDQLEKAAKAAAGTNDPTAAMQSAADALAELSKKLPDRQQRLKAARAELNKVLEEQTALTRQAEAAARTEKSTDALSKKLEAAAKKQDELAKRVRDLDVPGLESRQKAAADAAGRAGEDMKAGLPLDIPASQKDLGRQLDRLKQAIDGQTPADALADQLARKQRELATEFAKPGGVPPPKDLEQLQRLQRDINKDLSGLSAPEAPGLENRAKDAARDAEKALRNPEDVDELRKKTKEAADALDKLADRMAGAESEADRVERLKRNRDQAAEKAKEQQQAGKPVDPDAGQEAKKQAQRDLDELEQTRSGAAQGAKQKAVEELKKLAQSNGPDRQASQQQSAADALGELSKQMKKNGDRSASAPRSDPAGEKGDDAAGVPSKEKAAAARQLAKEQRELRNDLSRATEQAGKGRPPGDPAKLTNLEKQQEQLAKEAGQLAKEAANTGAGEPAKKAAEAAEKAAGQLAAGGPAGAQQSAEQAAQSLKDTAKAGAGSQAGQKAGELAQKQEALAKAIGDESKNAGAAQARQARREKELADRAGQLADGLDQAAGRPNAQEKAGDLKDAADAARDAQRQLDRAAGEAAAGRPTSTNDARKAADGAVQKAKDLTAKAAGQKPGDGPPGDGKGNDRARDALDAVQQADRAMKDARAELGKGNTPGAKGQMDKAEKALLDAAKKLNPDGDGNGEPGNPTPGPPMPGGQNSGNNDGSAQAAVSPADLSPDLQQYAGKPWGEIPGEIQQRIIQDLKAKYGEDYARVIKLYFTEIANRK